MIRTFPCLLAILVLFVSGCNRPTMKTQSRVSEAYVSDSGSVGFDITPTSNPDGSVWIEATYKAQGKLARFGIEFGPMRKVDNKDKDFVFGTGEGRFVAESESDASALLGDLQKALEAKNSAPRVQRVKALPFEFVNIGDHLSQAKDGGFNADPAGDWTAIKIFIGEGEQEGEVFVNFNPIIRKGQFSIKDPEYGDIVLKQLASVL